jgi:hypothetical protein
MASVPPAAAAQPASAVGLASGSAPTANPNEIVLQAGDSEDFPTTLPSRLVGLVAADEFTASIQRINQAKRRGCTYKLFLCTSLAAFC